MVPLALSCRSLKWSAEAVAGKEKSQEAQIPANY